MRKFVLGAALFLLSAFLMAGDFWKEKPYKEWSEEEARELLTESPWVGISKHQLFSSTKRIAGNREREEVLYIFMFRSAKPVRMAIARMAMLGGQIDGEQADQYVADEPYGGDFVVSVSINPPGRADILEELRTEKLRDSTYLELGDGRKIPLQRYIPPAETNTNDGILLFPRQEVGPESKEVVIVSEMEKGVKAKAKFKVKDLVFDGKVEL